MYEEIDLNRPLKIGIVCGDRSGPFLHDFGIPIPFMEKCTGLRFTVFEVLDPKLLSEFDLVHFQRQYAPESLIILRNLKEEGKVCIALVDDDVWDLPKSNPAYSTYQGAVLERFQLILAEAHAITTSTLYLKELISRFNPNCHIFRNLVDPTIENFKTIGRDNPGEIRIGWTTTVHHTDDAPYAMPALREVCEKYPQVKLVFMGWLPPYIRDKIKRDRYEYYDFVPSDAFYACLGALDLDIGIAPLEDNNFNRGKSNRKILEYSVLKIPAAVSPYAPYKEWEHDKTCLKPKNNSHYSWVNELSKMIENKDLRDRLSEAAHAQVLKNHNINTFIKERAETYYKIYDSVKGA